MQPAMGGLRDQMESDMTLASQRDPQFAALEDAEVTLAAIAAEAVRKELLVQMDAGADVDQALLAVDAKIARLDDELCARDMDYPRT